MELTLLTNEGKAANGKLTVSEAVFDREFNEPLIHQVVTAFQAGHRQGSKANKSRSDVKGGGAKPWRQKGTGRARAGSRSSPIWRSGGVTFASRPRDFSQKVNKKMYKGAMQAIISELIRQDRLIVVEDFTLEQPKTRELVAKLKKLDLKEALIITHSISENLYLSSRNLYKVDVCDVSGLNPVDMIVSQKVLITKDALKKLEDLLA